MTKGYYQKKNLNEAINFYTKAIEMDPKQAYLYARKGKILHENGEFESAIQAYNKSMELESNNFLLIWKVRT